MKSGDAPVVRNRDSASYEPLRTVEKTMTVLEELSRHAARRVGELSAATAIPAPTVVRILETLCHIGYVRKLPGRTGYCLTRRVTMLAAGFHGLPDVFDAICRSADRLTHDLKWPASVCVFDRDAMTVYYSTIPVSPLSHKHSTLNRRLDMLTRAHGRAWLAFCEDEERLRIWRVLVETGRHAGPPPAIEAEMAPILASIRQTGVARRDAATEPDTTTLAAPVVIAGRLTATIGLTHFAGSSVDPALLALRLKRACREAAEAVHDDDLNGKAGDD